MRSVRSFTLRLLAYITATILLAAAQTALSAPVSIWPANAVPVVPADADSQAVEVGVKFRADSAGTISGIRFYKSATNTGVHTANLWDATTGQRLAFIDFSNETASGWQQVNFTLPVAINANQVYIASYHTSTGHYASDVNFFTNAGVDNAPLHALKNGVSGGNGVYKYGAGSAFPTDTFQSTNYWVDVVFNATTDSTPPTVTAQAPAPGANGVSPSTAVTATFSEAVQPATIIFTLKAGNVTVPTAPVTYNSTTRVATIQPSSSLAASTTYTATVSGAKDTAGNTMSPPVTWTFTTASTGNSGCPCSIWPSTTLPEAPAESDPQAVELGVKFRADVDGTITGIRFYKMTPNTGTHLAHLWTSTGTLLASAQFSGETPSGWQEVTFGTPVNIKANTTYIASYHTAVGRYADDIDYFASSGIDRGPLHALKDGADGPNGVYAYTTGTAFPNKTWKSSNYWVDVVFTTTNVPPAPVVIDQTPAPHAIGVGSGAAVTATFNVSVSNVAFTLTGPGNVTVLTDFGYDDATHTATLQPKGSLAPSSTYTATVSGATDTANHPMTGPVTWSFTTAANSLGQWSEVYDWPCVAIHASLLPDGKILSWADDDGLNGTRNIGSTKTYVTPIPVNGPPGTPLPVKNDLVNLFCAGHTFLPDGRLLTTGGHNGVDQYGADSVLIFSGGGNTYTWTEQPQKMNKGRWYPTTLGLATGEAVVLGGTFATGQYNNLPQVWLTNSGGGFRDLTSAQVQLGYYYYPRMHLAPNGKLFMAGPDQLTRYLDTKGAGAWTNLANRLYGLRDYGSSAMYDDGKVLMVGGGNPPTATAEIIDLNAPTPTWTWTNQMSFARRQLNATILPDGKVLATGGTSSPGSNDATLAVLAAEMWDPATGKWTTLASMQVPRLYHSTALLLPDGRVLSAGGGRPPASGGGTDNWNAEIYSPPYLFAGPRPTITSAPTTNIPYGQVFSVQTPDAASISKVTLVRLSSVTHAFNMNQRFKSLVFTKAGSALNVTAPSDPNITPPGHYMLFILNGNGVPSVAKIIQILN